MNPLQKLLDSTLFNCLFLLASLVYSLVFIFYGLDFGDTFFYINLCMDYTSFPIMTLTLLIGNGWANLFGDSLLSFRILNWLLRTTIIALPFIILTVPGNRKINLKFVAIALLLITTLNGNTFGNDACTRFFLVLAVSFFIKYFIKQNLLNLILYGIFASLFMLTRISNILIIPVTVIGLFINEFYNNFKQLHFKKFLAGLFKKTLLVFAVTSVVYFIVILFVYGSLTEYYMKLTISIANIDESHTIGSMINGYWRDAKLLLPFLIVCLILYAASIKAQFYVQVRYTIQFLGAILFVFFLKDYVGIKEYNWNLSLFCSAVAYSLMIISGIYFVRTRQYFSFFILLVICVFSILPILGSNTRLLKLSPFLISFLPVILIYSKDLLANNTFLKVLTMILLAFVVLTRFEIFYEESRMSELKYESTLKKIDNIKTTKLKVDYIREVLNDYEKYNTACRTVLFYGKSSYIFYYLTNNKPLYLNRFWMLPESVKEVKRAESFIASNKPVVFFLPAYPQNAEKFFTDRKINSLFEKMLLGKGYHTSTKDKYIIYDTDL